VGCDVSLYRVTATHYAPKGSWTGIDRIVSAPDDAAVCDHINSFAYWIDEDLDEDQEDDGWSPDAAMSDSETERALSLGLTIEAEPWGVTITGPRRAMIMFHRGDHYRDVEDAYYGCTQYQWEEVVGEYDEATARLLFGNRYEPTSPQDTP
jgi:hypothetical protein